MVGIWGLQGRGEKRSRISSFLPPIRYNNTQKVEGRRRHSNFLPLPFPPPFVRTGGKWDRGREGGGGGGRGKNIWESLPRIDAPWNYENDPSLPHSYWCMGSGFWKEKKVFLIITLSPPLPPPIYTAVEYIVEGKGRLCTSRSWPWGLFSRIEEEAPTSFFC